MGLIESIKAVAIRGADALNKLNDPFPPFDRPALPKEPKKLSDLELEFYQDLVGSFWGCDGQVLLHRIPLPTGSPLDTGDQAIWHGVYSAMLALRYRLMYVADKNSTTYDDLVQSVKGMQLHQTIHGELKPRLIRGVADDLKTWQDDASNDSATGHLLGIYATWKWGPPTLQPVCAQLLGGLALELLEHNHSLVGPNGAPTTYGALEQGWKTDPLRISLALAIYAAGATVCRSGAFAKAYSDLFKKYGTLACYPKVKLWWLDNANDTHRAAIHLAILADTTTGAPHDSYRAGLRRVQDMALKDGNVWVLALCAFALQEHHPDIRPLTLKVLSEFTLADKQFNPGRDNYASLHPINGWQYKPVLWNGKYMANQPLPRWAVRAQDFFWQRNLRSLDVGSSGAQADSRLNGGDFLAAYWLARSAGVLNAMD